MDKAGHIFLGATLGAILVLLTHYYWGWFDFKNIVNIILIIVIIYVYSLLEDIDTRASQIVWTFIPIGLISAFAGYFMNSEVFLIAGLGLITVTFLAAQFLPHRGFTHSIIFGIAVSLPWIYVSYHYSILAFVCFYSHLMADNLFFKFI